MITATPILPLRTPEEAAQLACRFTRAQGYGAGINVIAAGRPDDYGAVEASRCVGPRCAHWLAYRERVDLQDGAVPEGDGWSIETDSKPWALWTRATRGRCGLVLIDVRPFEVAP